MKSAVPHFNCSETLIVDKSSLGDMSFCPEVVQVNTLHVIGVKQIEILWLPLAESYLLFYYLEGNPQ